MKYSNFVILLFAKLCTPPPQTEHQRKNVRNLLETIFSSLKLKVQLFVFRLVYMLFSFPFKEN